MSEREDATPWRLVVALLGGTELRRTSIPARSARCRRSSWWLMA